MDKEQFNNSVNVLKQSPIFVMSLGSKELFHSNFWKYLMDKKEFDSFIKLFFKDANLSDGYKVEREKENMDLLITAGGKRYVIENKIKSYPNEKQLIEYSENNIAQGIITGIKKPPFQLPEKWDFISYQDIAECLETIKPNDSFLESILKEYCKVLRSIDYLMKEALDESKNQLSFWTENIDSLHSVNLMDVYRKLRADDFVQYFIQHGFKEEFEDMAKEIKKDWSFKIDRSFNRTKATTSFKFVKYTNDKYINEIGIQIEGEQFRLFYGINGSSKEVVFKKGCDMGWLDPNYKIDFKHTTIEGRQTSMRDKMCSYGQQWVYQYFNILEEHQNYDEICQLLKTYLEKAFCIIKQYEL